MNTFTARMRNSVVSWSHSVKTTSSTTVHPKHRLGGNPSLTFVTTYRWRRYFSLTFPRCTFCLYVGVLILWRKSKDIMFCILSGVFALRNDRAYSFTIVWKWFSNLAPCSTKGELQQTRAGPTFVTWLSFMASNEVNSFLSFFVPNRTRRPSHAKSCSSSTESYKSQELGCHQSFQLWVGKKARRSSMRSSLGLARYLPACNKTYIIPQNSCSHGMGRGGETGFDTAGLCPAADVLRGWAFNEDEELFLYVCVKGKLFTYTDRSCSPAGMNLSAVCSGEASAVILPVIFMLYWL